MMLPHILLLAVAVQNAVAFPQLFPRLQRPSRPDGTLVPAVRWDHDDADLGHLVPKTRKRLYYADTAGRQDSTVRHKFLDMDANFKHKTVILEHSKYVSKIDCSPGQLVVTFDNNKAYKLAEQEWKQQPNLTFVTYKDGCGSSMNKRSFFSGSAVSFTKYFGGGAANLKVEEINVRDGLVDAKVGWGGYHPPSSPRTPGSHVKRFGSWNESISGPDIPIDLGFPSEMLTDSPWGQAAELIKEGDDDASLTVYCVGCGISGDMQLQGSAVFSILHGVESMAAGMNGQMTANMAIGVDAKTTWSQDWTKDLATATPPFLSVEDLFFVGPELTLKGSLGIDVTVEGTMLGGVGMSIGPFSANLDFVNSDNNRADGFEPQFTNRFDASDQISAKGTMGLPVELGIGIGIPVIDWKKTIGIVDTPGMEAEATYETGDSSASCDNGIAWDIKLTNGVTMDIFDETTIDILDWSSPSLVDGCIPV